MLRQEKYSIRWKIFTIPDKLENKNMKKKKNTVSREIGLEIAALLGKHFLKLEHMHYGYWANGLEVDISNLGAAQNNYTNLLLSQIPENAENILDVGCGLGHLAKTFVDAGYQVDCVSPSSFLAEHARTLLPESTHVYECYYQDLQTDQRYDVVMFSESFQYMKPEEAIEKSLSLLNSGGHLLISDFFRTDAPGRCALSGGHPLERFYNIIEKYPLEPLEDKDITEETAPNIDIEGAICREVALPIANQVQLFLHNRYPLMTKFLFWKYKKKLNKINDKYLSNERTGENFKKYKSYRILLYRKTN